jgi:hypothetical protein
VLELAQNRYLLELVQELVQLLELVQELVQLLVLVQEQLLELERYSMK